MLPSPGFIRYCVITYRDNFHAFLLNFVIAISQTLLIFIIIIYVLTVIESSLGGSSPYTSRDKTNKGKYT